MLQIQEIEKKLANWEVVEIPHAMWNRAVHNELFPTMQFAEVCLYDENTKKIGKIITRQDAIKENLKTSWLSPLEVYYRTNGTME